MCGIVGYVGKRNAKDVILDGLKRLEYRGYDSAGIALVRNGSVEIRKKVGEIRNLEERGLSLLLISHDLPMVEHISDRIVKL